MGLKVMRLDGHRVRQLREDKGLTLTELAARAQIAKQTLSDIELGRKDTSPPTASKLAKALKVPIRDLRPSD